MLFLFHNCSSLVRINSAINVSSLTSQMDSTFVGCANLEILTFTGTLRVDTWLSGAPKLTVASLLSVIDCRPHRDGSLQEDHLRSKKQGQTECCSAGLGN